MSKHILNVVVLSLLVGVFFKNSSYASEKLDEVMYSKSELAGGFGNDISKESLKSKVLAETITKTGFKVIATYNVGKAPHGLRLDGETVLVALSGEDAIIRTNLKTGKEMSRWSVPGVPLGITKSKNGWLVATFRGEDIVELDGLSGKQLERWNVGKSPSLFTPYQAAGMTYITSEFGDQFTVFDPIKNEIVRTYRTGVRPYPADVTHDGVLAFIPNRTDNTVSVIDLLNEKELIRTKVCEGPEGGALVEGENIYMVACGGGDEVMLINTASFEVIASIKDGIGKRPFSVAASEDGRFAFVNNAGGDTVSVIDIKTRKVVDKILVGKQPIVMRVYGNKLFVTNEVSGTLSVVEIPAATKAVVGTAKNEVLILGMIHGRHNTSERYGLPYLKRVFNAVNADYVLVEISPNRMEETFKGFRETGEITEVRSKRFPEYFGALFPLWHEQNEKFEIIPTAGWNRPMADYRSATLRRLRNDPDRRGDWAEYTAANAASNKASGDRRDDPYYVNSEQYDLDAEIGLEPYARLFNDEISPGGWTKINQAHYNHIAKTLDRLKGQGKRIMITYGAGHKGWFLNELKKRDDIILLDPKPFLDAGQIN